MQHLSQTFHCHQYVDLSGRGGGAKSDKEERKKSLSRETRTAHFCYGDVTDTGPALTCESNPRDKDWICLQRRSIWRIGRDWDGTHRLDLSCVSCPVMALSLGLKRLSGKREHVRAHSHTDTQAHKSMAVNHPSFFWYWKRLKASPLAEKKDDVAKYIKEQTRLCQVRTWIPPSLLTSQDICEFKRCIRSSHGLGHQWSYVIFLFIYFFLTLWTSLNLSLHPVVYVSVTASRGQKELLKKKKSLPLI